MFLIIFFSFFVWFKVFLIFLTIGYTYGTFDTLIGGISFQKYSLYFIISMKVKQEGYPEENQTPQQSSINSFHINSNTPSTRNNKNSTPKLRWMHKVNFSVKKFLKNTSINDSEKNSNTGPFQTDSYIEKKLIKLKPGFEKSKQISKKISIKKLINYKSNKQLNFKEKLKQYRISNLVNHYIQKLKRTSIYRAPLDYDPLRSELKNDSKMQGLQLCKTILYFFHTLNILVTFGMCFLGSFLLAFQQEIINLEYLNFFRIFSLIWIVIQIGLGFVLVRERSSRKLKFIKEVSKSYLKNEFFIDFMFLLSILSTFMHFRNQLKIIYLLTFFKIPQSFKKLKMFQQKLLQFFCYEHYWGLTKMFLFNFVFAHIIAISLLLMTELDHTQNWLLEKGFNDEYWLQKYYWAYYWATTTMLSVGYGDIVPTNHKQAIIVSIIQSISCMALGYNINCIGNLLVQLKVKEIEKDKHLKVLKQSYDNQEIQDQLKFKLEKHIKENYKMEKKLNFDRYLEFVQKLPTKLKKQFIGQSNKHIVKKAYFLNKFTNKTILRIAEKLQARMAHPWQLVYKFQQNQIVILKQGQVGICPNFGINKYNQIVIDKFSSNDQKQSSLINIDFLKYKSTVHNYDYKSVGHSILCYLNLKDFIQILRHHTVDFQVFYSIKHRQNKEFQLELVKCQHCNYYHSKFNCPKLHYIPIVQKVIFNHLRVVRQSKSFRKKIDRIKSKSTIFSTNFLHRSEIDYISQSAQYKDSKDQINMIDIKCFKTKNLNKISIENQPKSILKDSKISKVSFVQPQKQRKTKIYLRQIAENVKTQLIEFLKNQNNCDFWQIQIDKAKDYSNYFPSNNPNKLQNLGFKSYKSPYQRKAY